MVSEAWAALEAAAQEATDAFRTPDLPRAIVDLQAALEALAEEQAAEDGSGRVVKPLVAGASSLN